jgi:hypothetical protein
MRTISALARHSRCLARPRYQRISDLPAVSKRALRSYFRADHWEPAGETRRLFLFYGSPPDKCGDPLRDRADVALRSMTFDPKLG